MAQSCVSDHDGTKSSRKLTLPSLATVREALHDVRSKWEDVGIELLGKNETDAIKKERANNCGECLTEILSIYLKRSNPEPSWSSIIAALRTRTVGESQLAQDLEQRYLSLTAPSRQQNSLELQVDQLCIRREQSPYQIVDSLSFPYLDTSNLNSNERMDLIQKLSSDYTKILKKFATLQNATSESLDKRNISAEKIANCALSLALYKSNDVPRPLLEDEQDRFEEAKTIDKIFMLLRKYKLMSYFDYGILEHIIEIHGTEDDKRKLKEYVDEFRKFCQRRVVEVPSVISECTSSTRKIFKVLITADMSTTLSDIKAAERKIADILGLAHSELTLHEITPGSLVLTLSIPIQIADKIFALQASQLSQLKVNGFTILSDMTTMDQPCSSLMDEDKKDKDWKKKKSEADGRADLKLHRAEIICSSLMDEDKGKSKKWRKEKSKDDGRADLRLHRAETAHDLKKLLMKVEDHNVLDFNGDAPVHSYIRRRDKEKFNCLMTLLIYSKCDVNLPNKDGQTALHLACEANDINFVKALIAFDAKINSINNSYQTPLDIVLQNHHDSEMILLLEQLGGRTYSDMFYSEDDNGSGRVSPFREVDVVDQQLEESHIHHVEGGADKSPSPSNQRLSPVGQLPGLPEEEEHDLIFKSARLFPNIGTSSITGRQSLIATQDETSSTMKRLLPLPSFEAYTYNNLLGSKMHDGSKKMGPTLVSKKPIQLMESTNLEDSVSSDSSDCVLKKDAFFLDFLTREQEYREQEYRELYSPKASPAKLGFDATLEKMDVAESLEQPQRLMDLVSPGVQTSPDQLRYIHHTHRQHVHSDNQAEKGSQLHLPLSYCKYNRRMKVAFHRQHRPTRSLNMYNSENMYNPEMEVLTSIIGHSVVRRTLEKLRGQKVLCLDGGGVKALIQIEMLKTIEQMMGKSISDLFDWVVGTSTGGILALGMIYGRLSLAELRRVYFEMKDTVFKQQQSKFISHTCDTNAMESLLKRMLGTEIRMDDITKPNVLITAVDKRTTRLPLVFFNNCFEEVKDKSIRNELVWKVARYTSAAPVFFAECDNYVDGGVVANNPTTFALPEIQEFLTKKHGYKSPAAKISCVVSLGCGIYPPEPLGNTDIADVLKITKLLSAPRHLDDLLTLFTTALGDSEEVARLCRINCEQQGISFFRFSPEIGEDVGTTEKDNRKLCGIITRTKALFVDNIDQVKEMIKALGCRMQAL